MSRRKQPKPRSFKREADDGEELAAMITNENETENENEAGESQADADDSHSKLNSDNSHETPSIKQRENKFTNDTSGHFNKLSPAGITAAITSLSNDDSGDNDDDGNEEYRCEMCPAAFYTLNHFMDHRNYGCTSDGKVWTEDGSTCLSENSSSHSSTETGRVSCSDPLPYAVGTDENHPFACQSCDKAFSKQSYLNKHEQIVHNEQPMHYDCKYCQRLFRHKRSRDRHVKLHTGDKRYKCPRCLIMFSRSDHLKVHMKTCTQSLQCPECSLSFSTISALTDHILTHPDQTDQQPSDSSDESRYLACPMCSSTFPSSFLLCKHIQMHSQEENDHEEMDVSKDTKPKIENYSGRASAACEDSLSSTKRSRTQTPEEQKLESGNRLSCPYCLRDSFSSVARLVTHIGTAHAEISNNLMSCSVCNLSFASLGSLDQHMKDDHPKISLSCDFCPMEFLDPGALRIHLEDIHREKNNMMMTPTPISTIYCSQCTMGFPHIYALADHMHESHGYNKSARANPVSYSPLTPFALHATSPEQLASVRSYRDLQRLLVESVVADSVGNRLDSYRCHQCDIVLGDLRSYQIHIDSHRAIKSPPCSGDSSKLTCSECDMRCSTEEQLESHMFSHFLVLSTEYGCTSCLKLFSKPDELQKHLIDIHAHHLYRCSLCKHVFDSKVNIQVHFAVKHSNECKVYKCSQCTSIFRSEMEWQLHVKVHHLGVPNPYRCFFCKDSFVSEPELLAHVASHKKQYVCPVCHEAFLVEYLLDKHLETKHSSPELQGIRAESLSVKSMLTPTLQMNDGVMSAGMQSNVSPSSVMSDNKRTSVSPSAFVEHGTSSPNSRKGDLIYKCEVCDVKFSDESSLQKHQTHDHSLSAEMQQMMKSRTAAQQSTAAEKSGASSNGANGSATTGSDKFSQLCMYCKQTFKTKAELEKHMKTHILPSNQKCNICDEVFPSSMILAEHKLTHCKVVRGNVCIVCKATLKNEDEFFSHAQQHSFQGANMQCVVCRQTLASMLELQLHGRHHFQLQPTEMFSCCICLKAFDSKENLIARPGDRSFYICKPCYHQENTASVSELKCGTCGMKFDNQIMLALHVQEHRRTYQCIKCQESFASEYEIQLHVATHVLHEGNIHECKICGGSFDSPAKLQLHLIEHSFQGKADMTCYICDRTFVQAGAIQVHMLDHGMANRKYICSLCPQRFFFSAELQNHLMSLNHGSPSPKSIQNDLCCTDCSKSFSNYANLSAHRRVHEKQQASLECSVCPVQCSSVRSLQEHFVLSHTEPNSTKQPLQCPECNRQFPSLSSLQGHMRVHNSGTKYSCTECGKAFSLPQNLAIHMNSHRDDVRPFECTHCHKKFAKRENMKSHMRCHCPTKDSSIDPPQLISGIDHQEPANVNHTSTFDAISREMLLVRSQSIGEMKPEEHLCPICGGRFQQMVDLALHVNKIHHIKAEVVEAEIVRDECISTTNSRHIVDCERISPELIASQNGLNNNHRTPSPLASN